MKKTIFLMTLAFGITGAFAQESGLTSKKGEPYLPEAGDYAISFDANPFLQYAGNMFSGATATNAAAGATWVNPGVMAITGKYFQDAKTAFRVTLRLGNSGVTQKAQINDATVTTLPTYPNMTAKKEDVYKKHSHFYGIGAGIEMRKGKTRLQGYYGGEGMIWMSGGQNKFTYGNALAASGTVVTAAASTNFSTYSPAYTNLTTDTYGNVARVTKEKDGSTFGIGVRGFIGAEYFLFPKISIGAEYGWGIGLSTTGQSTTTVESVGGAPASVGTQETKSGKSSKLGIDTDINGGFGAGTASLKISLHF